MATLQEEYDDLEEMVSIIESPLFQRMIVEPLRREEDALKTDFYSDSLKEAWRKGGKREGIEVFFKTLKTMHEEYKNKRDELNQEQS